MDAAAFGFAAPSSMPSRQSHPALATEKTLRLRRPNARDDMRTTKGPQRLVDLSASPGYARRRMRGLLSEGVVPGMLRDIYVGRRSGLLAFSRGEERYAVRFVKGNIVHAQSSVPQAHLGEIMVGQGMLDQADLDRATEVVRGTRKRLGLVLLELGILDRGLIEDALALQVREHLMSVFAWTEGLCAFEEQEAPPVRDHDFTLKLSTGQMILESVRRVRSHDVVRYGLGSLDRILALSSDPLLRFQRITLSSTDGFVLSRVDGLTSARQIFQITPAPQEEAERSLFGLLCTGIVEYLPGEAGEAAPPADARRAEILDAYHSLAERDYFQVLEIARDASHAGVMAAYYRQARRFHPDVHHEPALSDLRDPIEAVFQRVSEAYETLRRPALRQSYELGLDRMEHAAAAQSPDTALDAAEQARQAEAVLRNAEERLGEGRHWEAIGLLEGLVAITRGLLRQRARLLLADAYAKTPRAGKSAEQELIAILEENPSNVEARLRLALLYRDLGLTARASEHLRRILEARPQHRGALELMSQLGGAAGEPKGFLRKLLGG
jgi:curved DNA-binding protein CbpA